IIKRYRHYNKDRAIILSCFGSVVQQQKYLELKSFIEEQFEDIDVFIAFSSRMVIKKLAKKGEEYKNLPQVLADVDMLGYKKIVVASINLFPTDEHDYISSIVDGFKNFSLSHIKLTKAVLTKAKDTTKFLMELSEAVKKEETANLFIIHGTPDLDNAGIASIKYAEDMLADLSPNNYSCSLEGAHPFYAVKDSLVAKWKEKGIKNIQVVPLLLVSGNHFVKDMVEIRDELSEDFNVGIAPSLTKSENFNLIEMESVRKIIKTNISEKLKQV
ncbi:MAG: sirohydrochlorin cobaltochelatase, partial [Campylobacterales bacterium]|nr:sirohydrochlorin cobaltochelatase [Campylobacterales bacterium]